MLKKLLNWFRGLVKKEEVIVTPPKPQVKKPHPSQSGASITFGSGASTNL